MHSYIRKLCSRSTWRFCAVCLAALIAAACTAESHSASTATAEGGRSGRGRGNAAVPVRTAAVQEKAVPVTLKAVGTVETVSSVQVRAQVTGQLSAVNFTEGQDVQEGQLLFTIDSRPFDAALAQARAAVSYTHLRAHETP